MTRYGQWQRIKVVIHSRCVSVTRHEIRQGLRTYGSQEAWENLRARMLESRGDGRTVDAIAPSLNGEGYQQARGTVFIGAPVYKLLAKFGQTGVPSGVRDATDLPGTDKWWLPELATRLSVKSVILHRWRWSGGLQTRQR